jgi:hypothetical protein
MNNVCQITVVILESSAFLRYHSFIYVCLHSICTMRNTLIYKRKGTRWSIQPVLVPFNTKIITTNYVPFLKLCRLRIHNSNGSHINDIVNTVTTLQNVNRFIHTHQNRAYRFSPTQMMQKLVADVS